MNNWVRPSEVEMVMAERMGGRRRERFNLTPKRRWLRELDLGQPIPFLAMLSVILR